MMPRLLLSLLALALIPSPPAGAELVVMTHGDVIKVDSYQVEGEQVRLELDLGGSLTVSLLAVERILDDEIVAREEPLPEPDLSLEFVADAAPENVPFADLIYGVARDHSLNAQLLAAMARAESGFDPNALSRKGARGLLQLMPATAERFGVPAIELYDPKRNLVAAARYLSWLKERFRGDLSRVLAAYNAGEGAVDRYGGVPPYRETRDYIIRIYGFLGREEPGL